jgi:hypothetical protein
VYSFCFSMALRSADKAEEEKKNCLRSTVPVFTVVPSVLSVLSLNLHGLVHNPEVLTFAAGFQCHIPGSHPDELARRALGMCKPCLSSHFASLGEL